MSTIDLKLKTGLSPAVWGAGIGVLFLGFVQFFSANLGDGSHSLVQPISGSFFEFIGHYLAYFFTQVPSLVVLGVTILLYIVGTISAQGGETTEPDTTAVMRGMLIGIGTGMNGILAYNIYGVWFGQTVGLIVGLVLFILGVISAVSEVSQSGVYQGLIGWLCWLAPMSWLVLGVGVILLVVSLVLGLGGLAGVEKLKVGGDASADPSVAGKIADANWSTGTFFLIGGLAGNFNYMPTAFDMGNIGFIHRKADEDHTGHESGHNLSLFVFGWMIHYIGAFDENVIGYRAKAFTELLAESHASRSGRSELEMWV